MDIILQKCVENSIKSKIGDFVKTENGWSQSWRSLNDVISMMSVSLNTTRASFLSSVGKTDQIQNVAIHLHHEL